MEGFRRRLWRNGREGEAYLRGERSGPINLGRQTAGAAVSTKVDSPTASQSPSAAMLFQPGIFCFGLLENRNAWVGVFP